ncbi:BZ3500_MvSof-1268-A1-R1_Chr7-1g09123 [Microbotryum saponariae]|uniref:BZ3500_MvSof-1268-A1-R1_Chr7-1g09123 protein n=1 Tax=Microbotryum saponariae TaxID=289078 RepID=A0A2X0NC80_9BASI|nr:BZ3501_MvSof-1269-A2-R1_Chr7-1g08828 [Microbotryum saponariae]SDA02846.1 BZ3500_MvSof-1268-A1-R1_Chr7-1g09123 [Microbotryum saponariae]
MSHSHTAHTIKSEKPPTSSDNLEPYKDQVMKDVQKVQLVLNEKVEMQVLGCLVVNRLLTVGTQADGTLVAPPIAPNQPTATLEHLRSRLGELGMTDSARKHYVDPAQEYLVAQAHARPIMTSLLGVFFALSFFPVLTFVLFSLGAILTVGGTALVISLAITESLLERPC